MAPREFQLQLNQTIEVQIQGQEGVVPAVVTNFVQDYVVLCFPQLARNPDGFAPKVAISIRRVDQTGLIIGASRIVELCAAPRPSIVVVNPANFKTIQNRRFSRVNVDFPCAFRVLASDKPTNVNLKIDNARVRDISAGGARIIAHQRVNVGDKLMMKIQPEQEPVKKAVSTTHPGLPMAKAPANGLPAGKAGAAPTPATPAPIPDKPIEALALRGRVVRVCESPGDRGPIITLGVQFQEVNKSHQDRLVNLVLELQRDQCKRS
jgi:hypothetical protein